MCRIPCWPSPQEAEKLIELGYGAQMMLNSRYHPRKGHEILVICPAKKGLESKTNWDTRDKRGKVRCTLQKAGLCSIHNICKPIEAQLAICTGPQPDNLRDQVALLWDNPSAQKLAKKWIKEFMKDKLIAEIYL